MRIHVKFQSIHRKKRLTFKCTGCGRRIARTANCERTVSPFNVKANGEMRSPAEVLEQVRLGLGDQCNAVCAIIVGNPCEKCGGLVRETTYDGTGPR